jgi:hypothetical protein
VRQFGGRSLAGFLVSPIGRFEASPEASIHARGARKPRPKGILNWLNSRLGNSPIRPAEDPPEDVFVSNVITAFGNFRVFTGLWEGSDFWLQAVLDALAPLTHSGVHQVLLNECLALLRLSDVVAERGGISRYARGSGIAGSRIGLPSNLKLDQIGQRVRFSEADLQKLQIHPAVLRPFCLTASQRQALVSQEIGHSDLERCPLLQYGTEIILVLPAAVSVAIRRYITETLYLVNQLGSLAAVLREQYSDLAFKEALPELDAAETSLRPSIELPSGAPRIDDRIFRIDADKMAHVILVHDRQSPTRNMDCLVSRIPASHGSPSDLLGPPPDGGPPFRQEPSRATSGPATTRRTGSARRVSAESGAVGSGSKAVFWSRY